MADKQHDDKTSGQGGADPASSGGSTTHDYGGLGQELEQVDLAGAQEVEGDPPGNLVVGLDETAISRQAGEDAGVDDRM